jgi:hypothetical protein
VPLVRFRADPGGDEVAEDVGGADGSSAIEVDRVLEEVSAETGLDDYGHPSFRDGLDVLVDNLASAHLNDIGKAAFDSSVRGALRNRLRVTDWHRTHPAAAATPPDVQIIVVGLSRTGTTALSHLLAADPHSRSLRQWEAQDSVPPPTAAGYWSDPRYLAARDAGNLLDLINPRFKAIHHDEPEDAVECAIPLSQHFASISLANQFNVAGYGDWLLSTDLRPAYDFHRQVLQVLGSDRGGPWQLKSPIHGYAMETVAAAYPDAVFVQTHRDPARCIASTLSLTECLSGTFTDHDFRDQIAKEWPEWLATIVDGILDHREAHGDDRFVDVAYQDLLDDPIACVRRIYAAVGRELTPEAEAAMEAHLADQVQGKYGHHTYSLAEFGLERGPIDERLARYWDRFDVPRERA